MDLKEILKKAFDAGYDNSLMYNNLGEETYFDFNDFYKKEIEAINYTHCCKSDSEQFSFADMRSAYDFSSSDEYRYDGVTFNEWMSKR
jgi:hypothetical protein